MSEPEKPPEQHGIQLNYIGIKEIHFDSVKLPSTISLSELDDTNLTVGRSPYDCLRHVIAVVVKAEAQTKSGDMHLRVELISEFRVDESLFPKEKVEEWAHKSAMFLLLPYLREHVFSMCVRVGLAPIIIPMMTLPPYWIKPSDETLTEKEHPIESAADA